MAKGVLDKLPLLNLFQLQQTPKKFRAVLDANVLYRLQDAIPEASEHEQLRLAEEAKTLNEDWISDDVHFLITDETLNEIHRNADRAERQRRRVFARKYERVSYDPEKEKELRERLTILFPDREGGSLSSDGIQLSQSIAAGASCFITQDRALLKRANQVSSQFGLSILSPAELTCRVDEVLRETQYRPASLAGSKRLNRSRIQSNEMASLYIDFLGTSEKKGEFESRVRNFCCSTRKIQL